MFSVNIVLRGPALVVCGWKSFLCLPCHRAGGNRPENCDALLARAQVASRCGSGSALSDKIAGPLCITEESLLWKAGAVFKDCPHSPVRRPATRGWGADGQTAEDVQGFPSRRAPVKGEGNSCSTQGCGGRPAQFQGHWSQTRAKRVKGPKEMPEAWGTGRGMLAPLRHGFVQVSSSALSPRPRDTGT